MAMSDEIREQRAKLKDASLWQKFLYYFGYYKWHVILFIGIGFYLVVAIWQTIIGQREKLLYGVLINANDTSRISDFQNDVGQLYDMDSKKQQVKFHIGASFDVEVWDEETYNSSAFLEALITVKDLDFISSQEPEFLYFAETGFFQRLDECLPTDVQELVEDYYYYYTDEDGNTYPLGIKLDDCTIFEDYGIYEKHETILGIIFNSERVDNTAEFIRFIFKESGIE
ncbi:MAG: hypothetical protein ACI4C1_01365 [Lachnospiraceae bacterium]